MAGTLTAYMGGVMGSLVRSMAESTVRTGVSGGVISGPQGGCDIDCSFVLGGHGFARNTSLHAPSPMVFFRPRSSVLNS
jgi:hypothetical protein